MTDQIINVEAALLFDAPYEAPSFPAFLGALNEGLAPLGIALRQTNASGENFAMFNVEDFHVLVSLNREPLAPDGFAGALASPYTQMKKAGFAERVKEHTGNIFITVGDGPMAMTPELLAMQQKLGMPDTRKAVALELKIIALHQAVLAMLGLVTPEPSAIHWCQSDTLHLPSAVDATREMEFPVPLLTHPGLFSSGRTEEGRRYVGFVSNHSKWFCGKTLVVPEVLNTGRMIEAVNFLIDGFVNDRIALRDGDLVPFGGDHLKVAHLPPDEGFPEGRIEVTMAGPDAAAPGGTSAPKSFAGLRQAAKPREAAAEEPAAAPQQARPASPAPKAEEAAPQPAKAAAPPASGDLDALMKGYSPKAAPELSGAAPQTARPEPGLEGEAAPRPEPAPDDETAPRKRPASLIAELFERDPEESKLRYAGLSLIVILGFPIVGVPLAVANVAVGPFPKLTQGLAVMAFLYIAARMIAF